MILLFMGEESLSFEGCKRKVSSLCTPMKDAWFVTWLELVELVPRRNELCTQIPLQSFSVILGNVIYFFFVTLKYWPVWDHLTFQTKFLLTFVKLLYLSSNFPCFPDHIHTTSNSACHVVFACQQTNLLWLCPYICLDTDEFKKCSLLFLLGFRSNFKWEVPQILH